MAVEHLHICPSSYLSVLVWICTVSRYAIYPRQLVWYMNKYNYGYSGSEYSWGVPLPISIKNFKLMRHMCSGKIG